MLEEAQRLNDLIESLLTLARMESGKMSIRPESLKLAELVTEVRDSLGVLAAEKEQTIELVGNISLTVTADRVLLRQALMNIIHNAIRYGPMRTRIAVSSDRRESQTVIKVSDQGPGIAPEHLAKIFDRFYRVDKARSRSEGGHGLGLAIAKWSVECQGGRIEVESEIGKGSTFRIFIQG
jgi:signal transduction histidine kinase